MYPEHGSVLHCIKLLMLKVWYETSGTGVTIVNICTHQELFIMLDS